MLKITGAILLVTGTTGVGISMFSNMKKRLFHVRYMHYLFTLLLSEIGYAKATMAEACRSISRKAESPYRQFLEQIYKEMEGNAGVSFAKVWQTAMQKHLLQLPLKETDREVIGSFADYTGYMDIELQKQLIGYKLQDLEKLTQQIEEEVEKQGKLYILFGAMSGLFLTVILL